MIEKVIDFNLTGPLPGVFKDNYSPLQEAVIHIFLCRPADSPIDLILTHLIDGKAFRRAIIFLSYEIVFPSFIH